MSRRSNQTGSRNESSAAKRESRPAGLADGWTVLAVCLVLVAIVWVVFGQTAGFGFVNYDDPDFWAGGHHLTTVALHAAATVLLFLVLRAMTGALWRSAFVAAVFGVHPLRAKSVAWIAERKDALSGMFFMLTLWAYVRYARQPSRGRYAAVALLFGLGLLSKNMLVTLPFVLLLLDWWLLGRMKGMQSAECRAQNAEGGADGSGGDPLWGLVREKIPLFLLSLGSCVATALVPEKLGAAARAPALERVENALVSYVLYLRQMVCPTGLANPYPLAPHGQDALYNLGTALGLKRDLPGAIAQYRKVLEINPDYPGLHHNLGVALANSGQMKEALAHYLPQGPGNQTGPTLCSEQSGGGAEERRAGGDIAKGSQTL